MAVSHHDKLKLELLRLSSKQQLAVDAIVNGASHAAAAKAANVTRETVTRWSGHHPAFRAALNLYRANVLDEQLDLARKVRGKALKSVEDGLDKGLVDPLAVLRILPMESTDSIGPYEPASVLDQNTVNARATLPPAPVPRNPDGFIDNLAVVMAPSQDERAEQVTIERLAAAAGVSVRP